MDDWEVKEMVIDVGNGQSWGKYRTVSYRWAPGPSDGEFEGKPAAILFGSDY